MKKLLFILPLLSGCGISVTTSGIQAGIIDREIREKDGSKLVVESFTGLRIQWLPNWTWTDVKSWFNKEEEQPEVVP